MNSKLIIALLTIVTTIVVASSCLNNNKSKEKLPETVSYNFHMRPILSDKCFKCHGPDPGQRKAQLRLDIADSAYAPLKETKGAFAIVAGKPEESELYKRISSTDSSYMMPEPSAHLGALTEYEIGLFKKWIEQGAKYENHWAFTPPQKKKLPEVSDKAWVKNEIDYFILEKLDEKNLEPNEEADKERLLKRASLDLTGLPPTMDMMDRFIKDQTFLMLPELSDHSS